MKIQVDEKNEILLTEVYSGIGFKTNYGEILDVCMRDSGYEFSYMGTKYEAKGGIIKKIRLNYDTAKKEISLSFADIAKSKANEIYEFFYAIADDNKRLAKQNSISFIKEHVLSTLDEPDLIFWESIISELETK